jgi:ubiquinone/menaquinone biosynthesis C-methylase UbiE
MTDGERTARQYDAMASDYAIDNLESATNAYYERPATISLLGDVKGKRVLEVGCGAGPLTEWLVDHGADVTAADVSPEMVRLARERVGERATFEVADLEQPLAFAPDGGFAGIVASLVLHYVERWDVLLKEFWRVLDPEGWVVFSTHHPTMDWRLANPDDYFAFQQVSEVWGKGSGSYEVTFWRRPLTAMTEAIWHAGFVIERLIEPEPLPELELRNPTAYRLLKTKPRFLFFRLRRGKH